ncbi:MAG TPA: universal stress protein [Nitrososphaeraceae archaeon]|nr:universal stress protein [Nitrososphaeraceae archaeon]
MPSRIIVGVDGSIQANKAFDYATSLAIRFEGSHLLIVNIFEKFATVGHSITEELQKGREEMLRKYLDKARTMGLKSVNVLQEEGSSAAKQILEIASRENIDTIVIGSRGQYLAEDFLLGSTSYKLAQSAKCNLIIIR